MMAANTLGGRVGTAVVNTPSGAEEVAAAAAATTMTHRVSTLARLDVCLETLIACHEDRRHEGTKFGINISKSM